MVASLMAEFITLSQQVDDNAPRTGAAKLTERELEVLRLVARGMSNKAIAGELVIAENTVKNHVRNILEKLHLRSRTEAAMYAVREKLVPAS
jgi:two-component system NarL family response regulator